MLVSLGSRLLTTNNKLTIPEKVLNALNVKQGEELSFFKDEYGRIIIQKNVAESILSTLELPAAKPAVQKVFP